MAEEPGGRSPAPPGTPGDCCGYGGHGRVLQLCALPVREGFASVVLVPGETAASCVFPWLCHVPPGHQGHPAPLLPARPTLGKGGGH